MPNVGEARLPREIPAGNPQITDKQLPAKPAKPAAGGDGYDGTVGPGSQAGSLPKKKGSAGALDALRAPRNNKTRKAGGPFSYRNQRGELLPNGNITAGERTLLDKGDLRGFWLSRVHKDPVARLGLAMWGRPGDLKAAIRAAKSWGELNRWEPHFGWFSRARVGLEVPSHVTLPPKTVDELTAYWQWVGDAGMEKLEDALREVRTPADRLKSKMRAVGKAMAREHVRAVDYDGHCTTGDSHERGLLSAAEVAAYHRRVFKEAGLPESTFGGTPAYVPVFVSLWFGAGAWLRGADPNNAPTN